MGGALSGHPERVRCCETPKESHLGGSWKDGPGAQERDLGCRRRSGSCQLGDRGEAVGQMRSPKHSVRSEGKNSTRDGTLGKIRFRGGRTEQKEPMKETKK